MTPQEFVKGDSRFTSDDPMEHAKLRYLDVFTLMRNYHDFCEQANINWEEDFSQENGNYQNSCVICDKMFIGNKHRVVCKRCSKLNCSANKALKVSYELIDVIEWQAQDNIVVIKDVKLFISAWRKELQGLASGVFISYERYKQIKETLKVFCIQDAIQPSRRWNKEHTDYEDLSGDQESIAIYKILEGENKNPDQQSALPTLEQCQAKADELAVDITDEAVITKEESGTFLTEGEKLPAEYIFYKEGIDDLINFCQGRGDNSVSGVFTSKESQKSESKNPDK